MRALFTMVLLLVICPLLILNAQTKENVKNKLKDIEGEATKITVQTDEGEVTFEGDEADYLLRKMKRDTKTHSFGFITPGDELHADAETFDFKMPAIPHLKIFRDSDEDMHLLSDYNKKITVENENGETVVTVKSMKDGEEVTETYKGVEAEKYLEELNKEEPVTIDFKGEDKKDKTIIIIK